MTRPLLTFLLLPICALALRAQDAAPPDDPRVNSGLEEVELSKLSDQSISPLGKEALSIEPTLWKHAETKNFVYHYFHGYVAGPVASEAEFYYGVIAKELNKETAQWERKSHIYIFENADDWAAFQKKASLDPWTGGIHSGGDLFIMRDAQAKFKGRTLGHEITHLVIYRFFGNGVPLWLNEGTAEYISIQAYATYLRARGYDTKPTSQVVAPGDFIPVATLVNFTAYPEDLKQVKVFYIESERLVRFLCSQDEAKFPDFLGAMSQGNKFETALSKVYGARFATTEDLDRAFKTYATQNPDKTY
ncbi:MAG TPA: hypothetical protein VG733_03620 [Chthoniobacteraceae bacterium]|nr:hypothetical protein [Chthoniobacteraceae bacterium]